MGLKIVGEIERLEAKNLSYHEFAENYMKKNQPVVLTGLMDGWQACKDWVKQNGEPNLDFFSTHFGKSKVQVADCGSREFTDQKRKQMSVSDFISHWQGRMDQSGDESLLYLKDWHFPKEYPDYTAYVTPPFFLDDWLNMYLDSYHMHKDTSVGCDSYALNCSDYRFVYMGSRGTWTPLHADVFRSYSWSANICGKKVWHFLSPSQSQLLFDRNLKNCVYDIFDDVPINQFPGFTETTWLRCTQERNEIIFVPSGWYHQVQNLEQGLRKKKLCFGFIVALRLVLPVRRRICFFSETSNPGNFSCISCTDILSEKALTLEDTISINHNWFNAFNLSWVWALLVKDYNEAKEYIEDIRHICDDFEGLCQRNLAANTGMNFLDFFTFLARFAIVSTTQLDHLLEEDKKWGITSLNKAHHLVSNLLSVRGVLDQMKSQDCFKGAKHSVELYQDQCVLPCIQELFKQTEFQGLTATIHKIYDRIASSVKPDNGITKSWDASRTFFIINVLEGDTEQSASINVNGPEPAEDVTFSMSSPEDLMRMIDCALKTFRRFASDLELVS